MKLDSMLQRDAEITARIRLSNQAGWVHRLFAFVAHSGDSWFWLLGLVLVWFVATPYWRARAAFIAIGMVFLAVFVLGIKFTVRRRRPEGEWGGIYRNTDPHSFPSGHASRAAMLAVLAIGLGPAWFGIVLLIWAPIVSLARVLMGVHYLSDVIAGLLIGTVAGLVFLSLHPLVTSLLPFLF